MPAKAKGRQSLKSLLKFPRNDVFNGPRAYNVSVESELRRLSNQPDVGQIQRWRHTLAVTHKNCRESLGSSEFLGRPWVLCEL